MIDLHCHLLPGIDDGPDTLEQSLELCKIAVADGITHAIVTPHIHPGRWENNGQTIALHCQALRQHLQDHNIALAIGFAGEVRLTDELMSQVEHDQIPYYGDVDGYHIMLLEFPHGHIIPGSDKLVAWLLERNIRPLIAHPERNKQVMNDVGLLQPFVSAGCWLQVTAGSILGNFGERAQALAEQLLDDNMVTVVASDGHNAGAREPRLKAAFEKISSRYGEDRARQLMLDRPRMIAGSQFK
jgi:protein-tyrosine phosphatase